MLNLTELQKIVIVTIQTKEGDFAPLVLADFREGYRSLTTDQEQVRHCKKWMKMYIGTIRP